ncbi:hypothetical protein CON64_07275 [Bacillus pseudomycoides]|nr:hypothetical protein CON64_07275 [Bacillus pseudomycoides]
MKTSGYAIECTKCGSREIAKGEMTVTINSKDKIPLATRDLKCVNCGYEETQSFSGHWVAIHK